jgi:hypothetical protein
LKNALEYWNCLNNNKDANLALSPIEQNQKYKLLLESYNLNKTRYIDYDLAVGYIIKISSLNKSGTESSRFHTFTNNSEHADIKHENVLKIN